MSDVLASTTITDPTNAAISYQIRVVHDTDARPEAEDAYADAATIQAWKDDEWLFAGVIVTPVIDGVEIEACEDSLWSVAFGDLPGVPHIGLDEIVTQHPVPEMLPTIREKLARELPAMVARLSRAVPSATSVTAEPLTLTVYVLGTDGSDVQSTGLIYLDRSMADEVAADHGLTVFTGTATIELKGSAQ